MIGFSKLDELYLKVTHLGLAGGAHGLAKPSVSSEAGPSILPPKEQLGRCSPAELSCISKRKALPEFTTTVTASPARGVVPPGEATRPLYHLRRLPVEELLAKVQQLEEERDRLQAENKKLWQRGRLAASADEIVQRVAQMHLAELRKACSEL